MIKFRKENKLLILSYSPTNSSAWVHELLNKQESVGLKKTFIFTKDDLYKDNDGGDEFDFVLGHLIDQYYLV